MGDYWFFLSYAKRDALGQEYLKRFYEDLARNVGYKAGLKKDIKDTEIGFFDESGIEAGQRWPDTLAKALQTSRVFVCLFSRGYFNSEYCGKEFQVFITRLKSYAAQKQIKLPPLIIPVLWDRPDRIPKLLPQVITDIQYTHDKFGQLYSEEGLNFIMRLQKHRDEYQEFLMKFAEKVVEAAESWPLPQAKDIELLDGMKGPFPTRPQITKSSQLSDSAGPRYVQFLFVAGRREEFRESKLKQWLECYGDEGGVDWQPYLPEVTDEVAMLAQEVAVAEKLRYEVLPLDVNIVQQLEEAERRNKIVAIIVDSWTLRLQRYHAFMREYDKRNFLNCVVLVPWNEKDDETVTSRAVLRNAVDLTFLNRTIAKDPNCFLDWIVSYEELKRELSATLNKARMRIVEKTELLKKAESALVISKPVITGPGEESS